MTLLAAGDANRSELVLEQKRLAKLWDAFKKQEDEYRQIEKERDELWQRVQDLEKAASALGGDPAQTLARMNALERENERLRADVGDLGNRLEDYRRQFHEEQERLAKLFKVYEDAEAQVERLQRELDKWHRFWTQYGEKMPLDVAKGAARTTGVKLSPAQLAQRQYAAQMRVIRKNAKETPGGKGRIKDRAAAKKLRAQLGLKSG